MIRQTVVLPLLVPKTGLERPVNERPSLIRSSFAEVFHTSNVPEMARGKAAEAAGS
jgi:hypothetical protein